MYIISSMASAAGSKAVFATKELVDRLKELRRPPSDISHIAEGATVSGGNDNHYNPSPQYQQPQTEYGK